MSEAIEQRAQELGWTPQDQFKGDPAKWVDAATYVERGETVLPILRKTNQDLNVRLTSANTEIANLKATVGETAAVIEDLKKFHTEQIAERVKSTREGLIRDIALARKEENVEQEIKLTNDLEELRTAEAAARAEEKKPPQRQQERKAEVDPVTAAWMGQNTWFGQDEEKTALAMGYAEKMRKQGIVGQALLDSVKKRVDEVFPAVRQEHIDRTEGGRHSGGGGGGNGGSGYASLPSDAKEVCDRDAKRFVGKPGFPDLKTWQDHFVQQYNAGA